MIFYWMYTKVILAITWGFVTPCLDKSIKGKKLAMKPHVSAGDTLMYAI